MAQHNVLDNNTILEIVNSINAKHFTTIEVVDRLKSNYPDIYNEMKRNSPRNFQSVIGKAIKRFSVSENKIRQISSADVSPAIWEKL
jgi:hypothetical protein